MRDRLFHGEGIHALRRRRESIAATKAANNLKQGGARLTTFNMYLTLDVTGHDASKEPELLETIPASSSRRSSCGATSSTTA